jgi:hypothetical protein
LSGSTASSALNSADPSTVPSGAASTIGDDDELSESNISAVSLALTINNPKKASSSSSSSNAAAVAKPLSQKAQKAQKAQEAARQAIQASMMTKFFSQEPKTALQAQKDLAASILMPSSSSSSSSSSSAAAAVAGAGAGAGGADDGARAAVAPYGGGGAGAGAGAADPAPIEALFNGLTAPLGLVPYMVWTFLRKKKTSKQLEDLCKQKGKPTLTATSIRTLPQQDQPMVLSVFNTLKPEAKAHLTDRYDDYCETFNLYNSTTGVPLQLFVDLRLLFISRAENPEDFDDDEQKDLDSLSRQYPDAARLLGERYPQAPAAPEPAAPSVAGSPAAAVPAAPEPAAPSVAGVKRERDDNDAEADEVVEAQPAAKRKKAEDGDGEDGDPIW